MSQEGHRVVVFLSCAGASKFLGAATLTDASGTLDFISTQHVPFHMVR